MGRFRLVRSSCVSTAACSRSLLVMVPSSFSNVIRSPFMFSSNGCLHTQLDLGNREFRRLPQIAVDGVVMKVRKNIATMGKRSELG